MILKDTMKTFIIYWVLDLFVKNLLSPCIHSYSCIQVSNRFFINMSFIPHLFLNTFCVLHFNWFCCIHWQKPGFLFWMIVCVLCLRESKRPILKKWSSWVLFQRPRCTTFMFWLFSNSLWLDQYFDFYEVKFLWNVFLKNLCGSDAWCPAPDAWSRCVFDRLLSTEH